MSLGEPLLRYVSSELYVEINMSGWMDNNWYYMYQIFLNTCIKYICDVDRFLKSQISNSS